MRILKSMIECRAKLDAIERSQAVAVFDTDGVITRANSNYLAIMGYAPDELLGRHHSLLVDKGHRDSADYRAFWDALRRGDFRSGTFKRVAKDGRTVWSNASYDPLIGRNGRPFGVLEVAEDITDAIVRSFDNEGQIQAIHKSQAVIEFLPNGTILTANDNFLRTMDYTLAEIEGRHHSIFVEPALRESVEYREFWETLRRGQYQSGEYRRIGRGGRSVWIHGSYNPVHDVDGVLQKVVKFAADVTSQAEDRIRRAEVQAVIDVDLRAISAAVATTSSRVAQAASASTLTSTKMTAVASGSKELASSVDEIGRRVADALIISQRAVVQANETNVIISGLANAAQKIGDIVELINTIAGRTNLLALNATIEAARAGEAGRGFAVVASEVKNLATQTAKATEEISDQIDKVQSTAITAVSVIEGMAQTITRINDISVAIATAVDQQSAVTRSISENMVVAAQNVGEIDETMSAIAAAAQSVDNATEKVKKASRTLA